MSVGRAIEEIAEFDRKLRMIDLELDRMRKIRENFERERNARQAYIDLFPVYMESDNQLREL